MMNDDMTSGVATADSYATPSLWSQVVSVGRFYWPRLQGQMIVYAATSLVLAVLVVLASRYNFKLGYTILTSVLQPAAMGLAPLAFARYNSRSVDISLPASWQAKSLFMIGYCAVLIPAVTMLIPALAELLFPGALNPNVLISRMAGNADIPTYLRVIHLLRLDIYIGGVVPALMTLWFVLKFRQSVVFKTIVGDVVVGLVIYIVAVVGFSVALTLRVVDKLEAGMRDDAAVKLVDVLVQDLMLPMIGWTYFVYFAAGIALVIMVIMKIKNRQI